MKKKILIGCGILLVSFTVAIIIIIRFVPGESLKKLVGENNVLSDTLCVYPVKVQGGSMEPTFSEGNVISFNKCFDKENISLGTIIVFKENGPMRLARVRGIEENSYKVSPDAREGDISEISFGNIVAIYKD